MWSLAVRTTGRGGVLLIGHHWQQDSCAWSREKEPAAKVASLGYSNSAATIPPPSSKSCHVDLPKSQGGGTHSKGGQTTPMHTAHRLHMRKQASIDIGRQREGGGADKGARTSSFSSSPWARHLGQEPPLGRKTHHKPEAMPRRKKTREKTKSMRAWPQTFLSRIRRRDSVKGTQVSTDPIELEAGCALKSKMLKSEEEKLSYKSMCQAQIPKCMLDNRARTTVSNARL